MKERQLAINRRLMYALGDAGNDVVTVVQDRRCQKQGYGGDLLIVNADGGCQPNSGQGSYGVVAEVDGCVVWTADIAIGLYH